MWGCTGKLNVAAQVLCSSAPNNCLSSCYFWKFPFSGRGIPAGALPDLIFFERLIECSIRPSGYPIVQEPFENNVQTIQTVARIGMRGVSQEKVAMRPEKTKVWCVHKCRRQLRSLHRAAAQRAQEGQHQRSALPHSYVIRPALLRLTSVKLMAMVSTRIARGAAARAACRR
jgi:hypothetical protein